MNNQAIEGKYRPAVASIVGRLERREPSSPHPPVCDGNENRSLL